MKPQTKEEKKIVKGIVYSIIHGEKEKYDLDSYIDDLVNLYDNDKICRGWFKSLIEFTIRETIKEHQKVNEK